MQPHIDPGFFHFIVSDSEPLNSAIVKTMSLLWVVASSILLKDFITENEYYKTI